MLFLFIDSYSSLPCFSQTLGLPNFGPKDGIAATMASRHFHHHMYDIPLFHRLFASHWGGLPAWKKIARVTSCHIPIMLSPMYTLPGAESDFSASRLGILPAWNSRNVWIHLAQILQKNNNFGLFRASDWPLFAIELGADLHEESRIPKTFFFLR